MHSIVLAVVVLLFGLHVIVASERDSIHPKITGPNRSINAPERAAIKKRFLRSFIAANVDGNDNDEERAGAQELSKLAQLDKTTWKLRKVDMKLSNKIWISWGKDPDYIFKYLKLIKTGEKIDETKKVIQWFRFVKDYRSAKGEGWFPDYRIYTLLLKAAQESNLATLFQSLKQIPDVKSLAETMQKYQFKRWIDLGNNPVSIVKLLGIPNRARLATEHDSRYDILMKFTKMYQAEKKLVRSATMP